MSAGLWRRAQRADVPALCAFLAARERTCAGFSGRLLREEAGGLRVLRLPSALRGGVWIREAQEGSGKPGGKLSGALLCHPSGLAFPVFSEADDPARQGPDSGLGGLARAISILQASRAWRPASVAGAARDVDRLEAAARLEPVVKVGYVSMSLEPPAAARLAAAGDARADRAFRVRRAVASDLDALMPLQEAYEREEVLTPIHEFNEAACRAALARGLELQLMYVAEETGPRGGSRIVAKAGTNARGLGVDQIGGVFTVPERRGRGAGLALMEALLGEIGAAGRGASLFVKPGNAAALALYRRLGFAETGAYRADYLLEG